MIEINLLPGSTKRSSKRPKVAGRTKKAAAGGGPKLPDFDRTKLMLVVGWVVGLAIVGWLHVSMNSRLGALRTEHEAAVRDSTRYATLRAQGDSLLAQEQLISQKMQVIQEIDAGRYTWAHIMDEVSRALPPYIWVVNMTEAFSEAGVPRLRLEGRAGNYFALGRYIEDLEASPFFRQVRLISSAQTTVDARTVLGFVLEASYEEPTPDVIETVPLFGAAQEEN
ncbi:MAG TPA: PilN domain-containing protein [Longimicrobiales bacterium]